NDGDREVRAQSAKVLGELRFPGAYGALTALLQDRDARVRFFGALSLGKLRRSEAVPAILGLLRENADKDPYLRHAGVMALTWIGDLDALMAAAREQSPAVRMGVLLA